MRNWSVFYPGIYIPHGLASLFKINFPRLLKVLAVLSIDRDICTKRFFKAAAILDSSSAHSLVGIDRVIWIASTGKRHVKSCQVMGN